MVRKETVELVQRVAKEIGYQPSALARGLRSSSIRLLGLVIRPLDSLDTFLPPGVDFFMRLTGAASVAALEHGYSLMLIADPSRPDTPLSALATDAYIVFEPIENDPVLDLLVRGQIPFITLGEDPARPGQFPAFNASGAWQTDDILSHFEELGARRVAMVSGTDLNAWNHESRTAYLSWCEARGQQPLLVSRSETEGEDVGESILAELMDSSAFEQPDAIYCMTGRHASGVVEAARIRGIRVPDELLVAGGSGTTQNETSSPSITAFDMQPEIHGQLAVEAVVALLEGRLTTRRLSAPRPKLVVRDSTRRTR